MSRRKSREYAIQVLFAIEMNEAPVNEVMASELFENAGEERFTKDLVEGVLLHMEEIDTYIETYMQGWELSRIGRVERAILRLCIYEWIIAKETEKSVAFNEAIELAKTFGDAKTSKFINGVLSRIQPKA